jgi:ClpP class serine protease
MTGQQAFDAKLVDHLGGFADAVKQAKHLAGLPESAPIEYPEDESGLLRKLLVGKPEAGSGVGWLDWLSGKTAASAPAAGWSILLRAPVHG